MPYLSTKGDPSVIIDQSTHLLMDGFIFSDIIPARIVHYGYGGGGAIWKVTLDQFQPYFCNSAYLLSVHIRSLGDVSRVITFAKLNEDDLLPVTQVFFQLWRTLLLIYSKVFSFAPALCSGDMKLLEMPPDLANSLAEGEILSLRFGWKGSV